MTIQDEKRLDDDTDLVTREMGPSHGTPVHHEDSIAHQVGPFESGTLATQTARLNLDPYHHL